ncbi:hypothetical protein [Undibacterium fentianense]|uniref:Uncharacterized protein n=1 Tax=Undibacterium fentianense TaxID=2828728 RepID=A0A941E303_9BURK|nr:hypothetical protein [Undibacterium fentianense]MBR7800127.1 hypothetical protein [Undibacterium fentianense]
MLLQKIFIRIGLVLGLMLTCLHPAWAQRDDGDYQILQARYGTEERNVDVTDVLKQLARRDRLFRMENEVFGVDPHPRRVKTLHIYARSDRGDVRTFEYREGSIVDGAIFQGWGGGRWGRANDYHGRWDDRKEFAERDDRGRAQWQDDGLFLIMNARYGTHERNIDVTDRLKDLARRDHQFRMNNRSFGFDPHPNRLKTLTIYARGPRGEMRTFEYIEGSVVDGNLFKSWSRGEWGRNDEFREHSRYDEGRYGANDHYRDSEEERERDRRVDWGRRSEI